MIRNIFAWLMVGLVAAGLSGRASAEKGDNTPPKGFKSLFNGKDLKGWQGAVTPRDRKKAKDLKALQKSANKRAFDHWMAKGGMVYHDGKRGAVNLATKKDYGDFELLLDWKIMKKGDSGIYLRGHPQVQIWDREEGSGGLYNNQKHERKPLLNADKPVGEWNTFRIIMKSDKVTVYLNGKKVVNNVPIENYWERGKPFPERGPIELQIHGNPLWFKNLYVKEL